MTNQTKNFCLWITGLSGAGKTTLAENLAGRLPDTLIIDGDELRKTNDFDFTENGRRAQVLTAAQLAKKTIESGKNVICALISPFAEARNQARKIIGADYIEVFLDVPLGICERRDPKGLYKKARAGEIENFTGISSAYERPVNPEIHLPAADTEFHAETCVNYLHENDYRGNALMIGKFRTFHQGHLELFREGLKREGFVTIAIRTNEFEATKTEIQNKLADYYGRFQIIHLPNITNVIYGRDVGYKITRIRFDEATESISATEVLATNG